MKSEFDDQPWYHGTPLELNTLWVGSTITQDRHLAEVFSHKPPIVVLEDNGDIRHNGTQLGWLYVIAEKLESGDIQPHPNSSMPAGLEWITQRELTLTLIGPVDFVDSELLTDEDIQELLKR